MQMTMKSMLAAAVLMIVCVAETATAGEVVAVNGATSVAEMLQKKQQRLWRAQLAAEGRWDEVRQLDASIAMDLRKKEKIRYADANDQFAYGGKQSQPQQKAEYNDCVPNK
jgi:hypothetical protein